MHQVQDLDIATAVFPLFDYTNTELSRKRLQKFFSDIPPTVDGVMVRQEIIASFISNWQHLEHFNYQVIDFREAYEYSCQLVSKATPEKQNLLVRQLSLLLQEKQIQRRKSKLIQLILLFHHLYSRFFSRLSKSAFPLSFQPTLSSFYTIIEQAEIQRFASIIKQNQFTNRQALAYEEKLQNLPTGLLINVWESLFLFEAYFSLAKGVVTHCFVFPQFQENHFEIKDFYHPLVKKPVRNSVALESTENVVLLTGPNMSGKSTLLKAISICVYLARLSLAVPASVCTIPYFAALSIQINSKDDLTSGYSHFMHELMALKSVLQESQKGNTCFVVFDEIFKGTNADDAQAILLETIQGLKHLQNSLFFLSTHFLNIKDHQQVQAPEVRKCHISCVLEEGKPLFTYKLVDGWSEVKIGKILFEQVGLSGLLRR